jgi:hypothetical protein
MTEFTIDFKQMNSKQISNFQIPLDKKITSMKIYNYSILPIILDFLPESLETLFIKNKSIYINYPNLINLPISVYHLIVSGSFDFYIIPQLPLSLTKLTFDKKFLMYYSLTNYFEPLVGSNIKEVNFNCAVEISKDEIENLIVSLNKCVTIKKIYFKKIIPHVNFLNEIQENTDFKVVSYKIDVGDDYDQLVNYNIDIHYNVIITRE